MGNGPNEPVVFTRDDAERLVRIEEKLDALSDFKDIINRNENQTIRNTTSIRYIKWIVGGLGSGGLLIILKIVGVF